MYCLLLSTYSIQKERAIKTVSGFFALSFAMSLLYNAVVRETAETFSLKKELILQIFTVI